MAPESRPLDWGGWHGFSPGELSFSDKEKQGATPIQAQSLWGLAHTYRNKLQSRRSEN